MYSISATKKKKAIKRTIMGISIAFNVLSFGWLFIEIRNEIIAGTLQNDALTGLGLFFVMALILCFFIQRYLNRGDGKRYRGLNDFRVEDREIIFRKIIMNGQSIDGESMLRPLKDEVQNTDWVQRLDEDWGETINRQWEKIKKTGQILRELLWDLARYNERLKNGEILLDSINKVLEKDIPRIKKTECVNFKAVVLIDDIGWTNIKLGQIDEGSASIRDGLHLAKTAKNFLLICRANRHLAGIEIKNAEKQREKGVEINASLLNYHIREANRYYEEYKSNISHIRKRNEKIELEAYLCYLEATIFAVQGKTTRAVTSFEKAKSLFEKNKDYERAIKVYFRLGRACTDNDAEAPDWYKKGIDAAHQRAIPDEELKNYRGIIDYYFKRGDQRYKDFIVQAETLAIKIHDDNMIDYISKLKTHDTKE